MLLLVKNVFLHRKKSKMVASLVKRHFAFLKTLNNEEHPPTHPPRPLPSLLPQLVLQESAENLI